MASHLYCKVVAIGGGAAGFFGAITCAERLGPGRVTLLERGPNFLQKVKISGGGRCNVTHSCFEPRPLSQRYPRGARALIGAFHKFQPADTVKWFESRGVTLKTESDGRMFPITDNSQTVIDCLVRSARDAGVELRLNCGVERIDRRADGGFRVTTTKGEAIECERVLLATGGCRAAAAGELAVTLGHTLAEPVPSLFTFHVKDPRIEGLAGLAVEHAEVSVPDAKLRENGPVLVTHWGLSGPGILRLSAWGARELHGLNYEFRLRVNWLPGKNFESVGPLLRAKRDTDGAKRVVNANPFPIPNRFWERLVAAAGIAQITQWSNVSREQHHALARQLIECEFTVTGKSLNKDEFVTCGGVRLPEVDFTTMESRVCPGVFFAGELLDVDGITGGFNFQAAWTTGWLAGNAMAESLDRVGVAK
ncbi:MAG: NAD(P)/FAD-dependent oxidoreductase [Verrucomicrobia bacterium]|nr:NAD(P)/FAD-dependent oxidoreductase [Verrucomicrobiota bacterium]